MGQTIYVPINPVVLRWAMRQAGIGADELAYKCSTTPEVVGQWLNGDSQPNKGQFNKLVARLRRPSGIYFLKEPPSAPALAAFRGPAGKSKPRQLSDEELVAVQQAERSQQVASWIREKHEDDLFTLPQLVDSAKLGGQVLTARSFLEWEVSTQTRASSPSVVWTKLRATLEDAGILVFQFSMGENGCRGFSLLDDYAPVVAVNSAYTVEARIFTLMHEYAHVARGDAHVCSQLPDSALERKCESFSAAFLMPPKAFRKAVERRVGAGKLVRDVDDVRALARRFKTSVRATAYRLERLSLAGPDLYDRVDEATDFKSGGFSPDNTRPAVRVRELGHSYPQLLCRAEASGLLGRTDVLEYLNVPNRQFEDLRNRLRDVPTDEAA